MCAQIHKMQCQHLWSMNRARLPSTVPPLPNASQTLLVILAERAGGGWGLWSGSDSDLVCQSNIKRLKCVSKYFHFWAALHLEQDHILFHRSTIITMTKRWMYITNDWYISFRHELPIELPFPAPCRFGTLVEKEITCMSAQRKESKFPLTALVTPTIWSAVKTRKSKRQMRTEWLSYVM